MIGQVEDPHEFPAFINHKGLATVRLIEALRGEEMLEEEFLIYRRAILRF